MIRLAVVCSKLSANASSITRVRFFRHSFGKAAKALTGGGPGRRRGSESRLGKCGVEKIKPPSPSKKLVSLFTVKDIVNILV